MCEYRASAQIKKQAEIEFLDDNFGNNVRKGTFSLVFISQFLPRRHVELVDDFGFKHSGFPFNQESFNHRLHR
jgi:hypothetical protein